MGKVSIGAGWIGALIGMIAMMQNVGNANLAAFGFGMTEFFLLAYSYTYSYILQVWKRLLLN